MRRDAILALLISAASVLGGEPLETTLSVPKAPVIIKVVQPGGGGVISEKKYPSGHSVKVAPGEKDDKLIAQVSHPNGKILWSYDFGYNYSALPGGCEISAFYEPDTRLLLIGYDGYKWDTTAKLLLISTQGGEPVVREYVMAEVDILPALQKRSEFPQGYKYVIKPRKTDEGVAFECIPLKLPESNAVHPFAQGEPRYMVTGRFTSAGKFLPAEITCSH